MPLAVVNYKLQKQYETLLSTYINTRILEEQWMYAQKLEVREDLGLSSNSVPYPDFRENI